MRIAHEVKMHENGGNANYKLLNGSFTALVEMNKLVYDLILIERRQQGNMQFTSAENYFTT